MFPIHFYSKTTPEIYYKMSNKTALEQLQELDCEYEERKRQIRQSAISELAKALSVKKEELRALEEQYEALVGRPVRSEAGAKSGEKQTRRRLSRDEHHALVERIRVFVGSRPEGVKMAEIVNAGGESVSATRKALASIQEIRTEGRKATTIYKFWSVFVR